MDHNLPSASTAVVLPRWADMNVQLQRWTSHLPPRHVHIVPSLSLGGAERIVVELAKTFSECGIEADIVVMRDAASEHVISAPGIEVHRLGKLSWPERLAYAAGLIKASGLPAYCHLTSEDELRKLWGYEAKTVPVVHNARGGWRQDPMIWNGNPLVPFVVACGDMVAEDIRATGLSTPVRVLRHIVRPPAPMDADQRRNVRAAFGADDKTLLIGMVGRFVTQKRYTRAVRLLAEIHRSGVDARLAIIGAATGDEGERCRKAVVDEASCLRVSNFISIPGPITNAGNLAPAWDVFVNTSVFEGVSISTMEAVAAGIPVVSADVGGQREAVSPEDVLLATDTDERDWADAIIRAAATRPASRRANAQVEREAVASLWPWMLAMGPGAPTRRADACDIVFVTGNMDVGGAQRSLCNLAAEMPSRGIRPVVAVAGPIGVPGFMKAAVAAGVEFIDVSGAKGSKGALRGRVGRILSLVRARSAKTVCLWNLDAKTKLAVAKVLAGGPIRVVDVSPGPMLYKELDAAALTASLLSSSPDAYVASLDVLVSKYMGGGPERGRAQPKEFAVIPNGVPAASEQLPLFEGPRPPPGDPGLAVVTVGRLTGAKRPELLPLVASALERRLPGSTLTVVGGTHGTDRDGAWARMLDRCGGIIPSNLHFVGPDDRTTAFLPRFACFYMVSTDQGCPNASLEAMASELPVVANPDGGTAEQIEDGVNGRLVADCGDDAVYAEDLAEAIVGILTQPSLAREMGRAGRVRAQALFSMDAMATAYIDTLLPH